MSASTPTTPATSHNGGNVKCRKNKQAPSHPWVVIGTARIERRKRIRREISEAIAAMRARP